MRIIDMLNSSRQMMFENSVESFEYSARGTGFLCRYLKHDFAITAHHVVRGFAADSIRILFHQSAREFVPYNAQLTIKIPDIEDPDWADLAVFPLEQTLYEDRAFGAELPYVIPDRSAFWQPDMLGHFIMREAAKALLRPATVALDFWQIAACVSSSRYNDAQLLAPL